MVQERILASHVFLLAALASHHVGKWEQRPYIPWNSSI